MLLVECPEFSWHFHFQLFPEINYVSQLGRKTLPQSNKNLD